MWSFFSGKTMTPWELYYSGDIEGAKKAFNDSVSAESLEEKVKISEDVYLDHAGFCIEIGELDKALDSLKMVELKKEYYDLSHISPKPPHCKVLIKEPAYYYAMIELIKGNFDLAFEKMEGVIIERGVVNITLRMFYQYLLSKKTTKDQQPNVISNVAKLLLEAKVILDNNYQSINYKKYAAENAVLFLLLSYKYFSNSLSATWLTSLDASINVSLKYIPHYLHQDYLQLLKNIHSLGDNKVLVNDDAKGTKRTILRMILGLENKEKAVMFLASSLTNNDSILSDIFYFQRSSKSSPSDSFGSLRDAKKGLLNIINSAGQAEQSKLVDVLRRNYPALYDRYYGEMKLLQSPLINQSYFASSSSVNTQTTQQLQTSTAPRMLYSFGSNEEGL